MGSGISNPSDLLVEMNNARHIFDIALQDGFHMDILDIGGGFYGRKGTEEQLLNVGQFTPSQCVNIPVSVSYMAKLFFVCLFVFLGGGVKRPDYYYTNK